jgi:hypothetical protein
VHNASETSFESLLKIIEMLHRYRADVDGQINTRRAEIFVKVDICTVKKINERLLKSRDTTYQRGDSVSTYSLVRGAVADDVRYVPRTSNACNCGQ